MSRPLRTATGNPAPPCVLALCDVDPTVSLGGVERHIIEIYQRWAAALSAGVTLLVIGDRAANQPSKLPGVRWRFAHGWQLRRLTGAQATLSLAIFRHAWRAIGEERPAVIHAHTLFFTSTLAAVLAGRLRGVPVVVTMHLGVLDALPRRQRLPARAWEWSLGRLVLRASRRVICVSDAVAEHARKLGVPPGKLTVIPNGVDCERFHPRRDGLPPSPPRILSVGRLLPNKGNAVLIEAAAILARQGLDFRLQFVGEGPDERTLRDQARRRDLGNTVEFCGPRDDVGPLLRDATVFVRPSFTEGMSLAVLEAMASGLPVVASDVTAMREVMSDGVDGCIVPPGDPDALAAAIARLLGDAGLRRRLGEAAAARARRQHSWDAIAARTLEVLESAARA